MKIFLRILVLSFLLYTPPLMAQWAPERTTLTADTRFDILPLNIQPQEVDPAGVRGIDSETGRAKAIDFPSPGTAGLFELRSGRARFSEYDLQSALATPGGLDPFSGYRTENVFRPAGFGWADIAGTFRSPAGISHGFYYYHPDQMNPSLEYRNILNNTRILSCGGAFGMIWGSTQNEEGQWEAFYLLPGTHSTPQTISKMRIVFPEVSSSEIVFGNGVVAATSRAVGIGNYQLQSAPDRSRIFYTTVYNDPRSNEVQDVGTFGGLSAKIQQVTGGDYLSHYYLLGNLFNTENRERAFIAEVNTDSTLRIRGSRQLGTLSGRSDESNHAYAVSRRQIAVGEVQIPGESQTKAFLYTPSLGMRDLNQLFRDSHDAENWQLLKATAISDTWGEGILIVGEGIYTPATYRRNLKGHWVREVTGPAVRKGFVMVPAEPGNSKSDVIGPLKGWE